MDLQVLQINRFPWDWDKALDGVPPGGDKDYLAARLAEAGPPGAATLNLEVEGLRYFVYSLVEGGPDTNFDREAVPADELRKILDDVETAAFLTMAGAPNGLDDLRVAGTALAVTLLPSWLIGRLFNLPKGTPLVVRVDDFAACVPWELCYSAAHGAFLCTHLAMSRGMMVRVSGGGAAAHRVGGAVSVSLSETSCLVNPEGDPGLEPCAKMLEDLALDLEKRGAAGFPILAETSRPRLLTAIGKPCFHYTGHIHFDPVLGSYIRCGDLRRFDVCTARAALGRGLVPKLALLNGCRSDAKGEGRPETERSATQTSFVREFYRNGVGAVIGTRWEVDLVTAQAANRHFYEGFAGEPQPIGELMRTFRESRATGWPCYVLYGDPRVPFVFPRSTTAVLRPQPAFSGDSGRSPRRPAPSEPIASPRLGGIRRPAVRTPQYLAILLENSDYVQQHPAILRSFEGLLRAVTSRAHALNAMLAHNSGALACAIRVEGCPTPLRTAPTGFTLPSIDLPWAECFGAAPPLLSRHRGFGRVLKDVLSELRGLMAQAQGMPLPAPIVLICLASDPSGTARGGSRDSDDAVRLCEDVRHLTLPTLHGHEYFAETTAQTIVLGFGEDAPLSLLRALAGSRGNGLWRLLHEAAEAQCFAERLLHSVLEPQDPEPLDWLSREDENRAAG